MRRLCAPCRAARLSATTKIFFAKIENGKIEKMQKKAKSQKGKFREILKAENRLLENENAGNVSNRLEPARTRLRAPLQKGRVPTAFRASPQSPL
jgi:hypothetical protein